MLTDAFPSAVGPACIRTTRWGESNFHTTNVPQFLIHNLPTATSAFSSVITMATAAVLAPHDVPTSLNYYAADPSSDETPYNFVHEPPAGKLRSNVGIDKHDVVVRDARGKQEEYGLSLDTSGFQYVSHVSEEKEFNDEERIKNVYYKEVEELLKKEAGAKRVFIFDHTIRLKPDDAKSADERVQFRGPVVRLPSFTVYG